VVTRCTHCGGSLYPEWDSELRQNVIKCLACGRTPKEEEKTVVETNGKAKWNPATKTLEQADAEAGNTPRTAIVSSADPVGAYNLAARGLLAAAEAHKVALVAEQRAIADARLAVERATNNLASARRTHEAARAKLDAALSGIATVDAPKPEPKKRQPKVGACKDCGQTAPLRMGRCPECVKPILKSMSDKRWASRRATKTAEAVTA
jgi:hypothetical protein